MNIALIQTALPEYGERALPGQPDNPDILQMAKDCGFTDYVHDSIAWCSLFTNWVALKAAFSRSKSLLARSWLTVGTETSAPELGDVVVYWRDSPGGTLGHVGLFIAQRNGVIYTLGGNEANMVQIEGFDPGKVLGYRSLTPVQQ
jgi:uncharacterized protein (TIGR02594 family)